MCSSTWEASRFAGHGCVKNGGSVGDSNAGFSKADCDAQAGEWTPYNCDIADDHLANERESAWEHYGHFFPIWQSKCCDTTSTPKSPNGPARCTAG